MIRIILIHLLTIFGYNFNKAARLEPEEPKSKFQIWVDKICPYVIFFGIIILAVTLIIVLIKYGHTITGTESNAYYYHLEG